jgi:uracil-DNA glycosylase
MQDDQLSIYERMERYITQQRELYGDLSQISLLSIHDHPDVPKSPSETDQIDASVISPQISEPVVTDVSLNDKMDNSLLSTVQTLDELYELCLTTNELRTDLEGTRLVFGKGNIHADLVLIGEAPGAEEDKLGEPFVGRSGQLLTKILEAIQFNRDQIYIANILKHRPPDNRNPTADERNRSLPYLLKQIELINPKLILCLGKISAETLLGINSTMKEMRGTFHNYSEKYELLVTYHPAALLRNPNWKHETWEDVKLLRKRYDELGCKP